MPITGKSPCRPAAFAAAALLVFAGGLDARSLPSAASDEWLKSALPKEWKAAEQRDVRAIASARQDLRRRRKLYEAQIRQAEGRRRAARKAGRWREALRAEQKINVLKRKIIISQKVGGSRVRQLECRLQWRRKKYRQRLHWLKSHS